MISLTRAEEAVDWLRRALNDGGRSAKELFRAGEAEGISRRTLQRAADTLKVGKGRKGFGEGSIWSLPDVVRASETAAMARTSTNGANQRIQEVLDELEVLSRRCELNHGENPGEKSEGL